jgi:ribonuclease T1
VTDRRRRATIAIAIGVVVVVGLVVWKVSQRTEWAYATESWPQSATTPSRATASLKVDTETGLPWMDAADLPSQGRQVLALIDKGGPYPSDQDGGTFSNAERLLPVKAKGFYTEYTVKLPSSSDRGPLRIIMGGRGQWYFWTSNHYASFTRIRR